MKPRLRMRPHVLVSSDGRTRLPSEVGYITVPESRLNPGAAEIELAVARIPANGGGRGPPLFVLAGGPGGEAINAVLGQLARISALAALGDVILLDQRGVGQSRPNLVSAERFALPLDEPNTRGTTIEEARRCASLCAEFWTERGVDLTGYTTVENADDVDELRRALGAERIRLTGGSYGSHLALSVLKRHPGTVERAALIGVEGPDDTIKLPSAVQSHLLTVGALAAQDAKVRGAVPDLLGLIGEIISRVEKSPVVVKTIDTENGEPSKVTVGPYDLQRFATEAAGSRQAIAKLPAAFAQFERSDFSGLAGRALGERRRPLGNAMAWVMDAASGLSDERRARIEAEAPAALLGDVIDLPHPHVREAIGAPDLGAEFRAPVRSDAEVLLVSGSLDGRTPPANAEAALKGLPNARHVVIEGMSHSGGPDGLQTLIFEFLSNGEVGAVPREPSLKFEAVRGSA